MRTCMFDNEDKNACVAAWLCSLQSFLFALAANPYEVEYLVKSVPADISYHLRDTLHKGWDTIMSEIKNTRIAKNVKLKELGILFLADRIKDDNQDYDEDYQPRQLDPYMYDNMDESYSAFEKRAKETVDKQRLAILMSQHPRLGRCSLLQLLPIPIVAQIVEKTLPKEGCGMNMGRTGRLPDFDTSYCSKSGTWTVLTKFGDEEEEEDYNNSEEEYS